MKICTLVLAVALVANGPVGADAAEPLRLLPMATGDVTGSYFEAGVALCRVVNEGRREHGVRCSAETSEGSISNVAALRDGTADLALMQADVLAAAEAGTGVFEGAPFPELRAVMALFPEPLTLVVAGDSGVSSLGELAGRRVSLGPKGAGQRAMVDAVLTGVGPLGEVLELAPLAAVEALCAGQADAFFFTVGHPALAVQEATAGCGARIVPIEGPAVAALVSEYPSLFLSEVPGGIYAGADTAVPTVAVGSVLVTRADVPDAEVEVVVGDILRRLPELARFDPTLAGLVPAEMASRGLTGPLHPGAQAAFRAAGAAD